MSPRLSGEALPRGKGGRGKACDLAEFFANEGMFGQTVTSPDAPRASVQTQQGRQGKG